LNQELSNLVHTIKNSSTTNYNVFAILSDHEAIFNCTTNAYTYSYKYVVIDVNFKGRAYCTDSLSGSWVQHERVGSSFADYLNVCD
jgi:hypothetical protein